MSWIPELRDEIVEATTIYAEPEAPVHVPLPHVRQNPLFALLGSQVAGVASQGRFHRRGERIRLQGTRYRASSLFSTCDSIALLIARSIWAASLNDRITASSAVLCTRSTALPCASCCLVNAISDGGRSTVPAHARRLVGRQSNVSSRPIRTASDTHVGSKDAIDDANREISAVPVGANAKAEWVESEHDPDKIDRAVTRECLPQTRRAQTASPEWGCIWEFPVIVHLLILISERKTVAIRKVDLVTEDGGAGRRRERQQGNGGG